MNSDPAQQAWQRQPISDPSTIDPDRLLDEVRREQRSFSAIIFWRDVREVGTGLVLIPVWIGLGIKGALPWTWYLMLPALLWVVGFMLIDRHRQNRRKIEPGAPLREHLTSSVAQVDHQIGLLRQVFWWYLLPLIPPMLAFLGQTTWLEHERVGGWWVLPPLGAVATLVAVVFAGVYWLNQYAVRADLEPRRRRLEAMLASLQDETA